MRRKEWDRDRKRTPEEKPAPRKLRVSPPSVASPGSLRNALGVEEMPRLFAPKPDQARTATPPEGSNRSDTDEVATSPVPGSDPGLDSSAQNHQGAPLKPPFREKMERALGADLGSVRIHQDDDAQRSSQAIDAEAFTRGENVFLGRNARALDPDAGQQLLAHEVVHVVQQRKASVVSNQVSRPGDVHEREADHVSRQALIGHRVTVGGGGPAPAIQRQPSGGSITKRFQVDVASRAEVKQAILEYLQRAQAAQGGSALHLNQAIRSALMFLSNADPPGSTEDTGKAVRGIAMENVLTSGSSDPADLAGRAANVLPEPFDRSALERLKKMPVADPEKSKMERVKDLAEKNLKKPPSPFDDMPDPAKQQDDIVDKMRAARGIPQPKTIGPGSIDIFGAIRTIRDLPATLKPKPPAPPTQTAPSASVEQVIAGIPVDLLMPPEARGTSQAGEFVQDAQDVARDLASKIDLAQRKGQETVDLRLPESYNHVKDRSAMIDAVVKLVKIVRDALPNQGAPVRFVDVYFGKRLVTRNVPPAP